MIPVSPNVTSVCREVATVQINQNEVDKEISPFSMELFQLLNFVGGLGVKPVDLIITQFQALRNSEVSTSIMTRIKMVALVTLFIPTAIITLPAIVLWELSRHLKRDIAYSPAVPQAEPLSRQFQSFKVMTWNIGLGPAFMSYENGLNPPDSRVDPILKMIREQNPNVLALQEAFDGQSTAAIVKKLNEEGYDVIHSVLNGYYLPAGLVLAVKRNGNIKFTLDEIKVWEFTNLTGGDELSRKGIVGVKLRYSEGNSEKELLLFNTHLQASYAWKGYANVRAEQVVGITKLINQWKANCSNANVILCGDMNFSAQPIVNTDNENEYSEHIHQMHEADLVDPYEGGQFNGKGSFVDLQNGQKLIKKGVVDYTMTSMDLFRRHRRTNIVKINHDSLPSDHYPVVSLFA
jgi:exonuclease III